MSKRRGLGKGLQALIPAAEKISPGQDQYREINIEEIQAAPRQARKLFDQEKLRELAASIKEHGVIQPVVVRPIAEGGYELITGERRWRACKALGYQSIPAFIKEYRDLDASAVSLIENVQREDLNPLEEALAYRQLMEDFGLTQEEVSGRVGKSRPFVANMVRLLGLPEEVKELIAAGKINAGHAKALLTIRDSKKQRSAAWKIARQQLSVRQAERMARIAAEKKEIKSEQKLLTADDINKSMEGLKKYLDAKVMVKQIQGGAGKLEINFSNEDDLRRIISIVLGGRKL